MPVVHRDISVQCFGVAADFKSVPADGAVQFSGFKIILYKISGLILPQIKDALRHKQMRECQGVGDTGYFPCIYERKHGVIFIALVLIDTTLIVECR